MASNVLKLTVIVLLVTTSSILMGQSESLSPLQSFGKSEQANPSTSYGPPNFTPGNPLTRVCRNTDPEANKKLVTDFYQEVFGNKKFELVDKYIAPDIINHSPMEVDGIDGLREVLMGPLGQGPPTKVDIKRVATDADLVWTHSRLPVPALGITYAVVDIFRINCDGLIQEHWDVLQDTNVMSRNSHPFF